MIHPGKSVCGGNGPDLYTCVSQTTMRVWDVLFNEGASILFIVALAIFKVRPD